MKTYSPNGAQETLRRLKQIKNRQLKLENGLA